MEFYDVVAQVLNLLQHQGRVSYRALKRQFSIDDEYIEDLKEELLYAHESSIQADDRGLTWTGETEDSPVTTSQPAQPEPQPIVEQAKPAQDISPPVEPHTLDAERRQLTVMFCDLVGSTELSGQLDPEDYREVVRAYQADSTEIIQRFDGYIAQHLGDGILCYFGFPTSHEDEAQRAVHTGLGMITAIKALNERLEPAHGVRLAVRIGIHTGLVVIGAVGAGTAQEQLALGEVPNVASRIQGLAEPDTVVISDATYRLIQGYFGCDVLGEHELRGVSQPIAVYRVLRESGAQSRLDVAGIRGLTPLIGRESESTLLFERWAQAKDGNGQVVLLSGEAGIGKSRLAEYLKDHVADEPHTRLECRSSPYYQNSAFYPVIDLIQRTLRWQQDDTPEQRLEKLEYELKQYMMPLEETVPLFAALLSLAVPEDSYPPINLTPQRQRQKTLENVVAILLELAEREPVLFIVEDLHWTDPSTLELLDLLIDQAPTVPIYTLMTCRPEFQSQWTNRSYFTQVTLNRLSGHSIEQIATGVTGGKSLPHEVLQQLIDKTDGVPLYVEEMTKAVLESGMLQETTSRYELTGSITSLSIPATLQDSLMARLDRLVTAKAVAQYGSVIGRQFSYELLQAVSSLDDTVLERELGLLVNAELVYQRGLPPQATYTFKHALIQDTASNSLLRSTRQQYHQRIAQTFEERFPETAEAQPELVAHHYTEAGLTEQAVGYWHQAGKTAIQRSANVEAVAHLTQGLELLKSLPNTSERARRELSLQNSLGLTYMAVRGYAAVEVEHVYVRARELSQEVDDTMEQIRALMGLYVLFFVRANHESVHALTEELLHLGQVVEDPLVLIQTYAHEGESLLWQGKLALAQTHLEHGKSLYRPQQYAPSAYFFGHHPVVQNLSVLGVALWLLGYPERSIQQCEQALTFAQELSHPFSLAFVLSTQARLYQWQRQSIIVQDQATTLVNISTEKGFSFRAAHGNMLLGWAMVEKGEGKAGIAQIEDGFAAYQKTGAKLLSAWWLTLRAEAYGKIGQVEEGIALLVEAIRTANNTGEHFYDAEIYRLKGDFLLQLSPDNATEAESCFHQAITIAQTQSAKSWELRAATSLARLWQQQNKRQEAYDLLAPVYNWFTEGHDTADLIDAKTLLVDELSEGLS